MSPPDSLCILRLSALGDATHVLPTLRAIQRAWPACRISWIIGKGEAKLLEGLEGVTFIVFDKKTGWRGLRGLRQQLQTQHFDVLLQMQLSLRANLIAALVPARRKIGYDRVRSKEGHGLVINERIESHSQRNHHVLDAFRQFLVPLGIDAGAVEWRLPVPQDAHAWARQQWPDDGQRTLVISPCSSHAIRNWRAERYAAVAEHAAQRGWRVVLMGGRSAAERAMGDAIAAQCRAPLLDLIGKDTMKQMVALLARADLVLSPDSGPVHIANAAGTAVLGLYACTDGTRSGPYSDGRWTVNHYEAAAQQFMGRPASQLGWGQRVEKPGVMDLISVDEVVKKFDDFAAQAFQPAL